MPMPMPIAARMTAAWPMMPTQTGRPRSAPQYRTTGSFAVGDHLHPRSRWLDPAGISRKFYRIVAGLALTEG
jgi:hypothetical protein